jgi:hypothetical protein
MRRTLGSSNVLRVHVFAWRDSHSCRAIFVWTSTATREQFPHKIKVPLRHSLPSVLSSVQLASKAPAAIAMPHRANCTHGIPFNQTRSNFHRDTNSTPLLAKRESEAAERCVFQLVKKFSLQLYMPI